MIALWHWTHFKKLPKRHSSIR